MLIINFHIIRRTFCLGFMLACVVRCSQGSVVRTAKIFSDGGSERLEHTSYVATVSGIRELHCVTHTEDVLTDAKLCPLQDVMELEKGQRGTTKGNQGNETTCKENLKILWRGWGLWLTFAKS